ncbi:MAG TPA: hypothetical protein VIM69_12825 [Opitutaceae bacterium]
MTAPRLAAFLLVCSLFSFTASAAPAQASVQELEKGLAYARIGDLGRDATQLEAALSKPTLILDLRDATGTAEEAKTLAGRLGQMPAKPTDHRLILINPRTAPAIVSAVEVTEPRQLTIGPRADGFQVDITVPTSVDDDERAFTAFASGTPLNKLDDSNPDKKRYDEATLAKNRAAAVAEAEGDNEDDSPSPSPTPTPATEKKPENPVHDYVLERAIQLHHALLVITPQSVAPDR